MTVGRRDNTSPVPDLLFSAVPLVAVAAAVPFARGWGLSDTDLILGAVCYGISCLGVTVGFHRQFTHGSYRAHRGLKIALSMAGQLALQGPVIDRVDHRRHHAFSDRDGDPPRPGCTGPRPRPWRRGSGTPPSAGSSTGT